MNLVGRYLALASAAVQQRVAYRNAFFLGIASQLLVALSLIYLWQAVYAGRPAVSGFSWPQLKTYLLLTFFTNMVIGWHSEMAVVGKILDGSVAIDLLKPLDFQAARLIETLGVALFEGAVMLLVLAALAAALGGIQLPPDLGTLSLALLSFGLGALIKFGVVYLTCMLAFWTHNGWGIVHARMALTQLFSGALVPLPFMPEWLRSWAEALPFQGMVYLPSSIYLGRVGDGVFGALGSQAVWAAALLITGRLAFAQAMRKVTIHGG